MRKKETKLFELFTVYFFRKIDKKLTTHAHIELKTTRHHPVLSVTFHAQGPNGMFCKPSN